MDYERLSKEVAKEDRAKRVIKEGERERSEDGQNNTSQTASAQLLQHGSKCRSNSLP